MKDGCTFCGLKPEGIRDAVRVCRRTRCRKLFNAAVDREMASPWYPATKTEDFLEAAHA